MPLPNGNYRVHREPGAAAFPFRDTTEPGAIGWHKARGDIFDGDVLVGYQSYCGRNTALADAVVEPQRRTEICPKCGRTMFKENREREASKPPVSG